MVSDASAGVTEIAVPNVTFEAVTDVAEGVEAVDLTTPVVLVVVTAVRVFAVKVSFPLVVQEKDNTPSSTTLADQDALLP